MIGQYGAAGMLRKTHPNEAFILHLVIFAPLFAWGYPGVSKARDATSHRQHRQIVSHDLTMSSTKPQCEPLQRPLATSTATKRESSINRTSKRPQTNALTESMDKSSLKQQKQSYNASVCASHRVNKYTSNGMSTDTMPGFGA
ncbi:hypothetical protein LTR37_013571 [Vermiconidia calcicola]|uniref:Uncharacterized protein n=1 Tax=Vermiconidia calcicola TaxID=1690605 RepID=A0ACC3MW42_9PEZI|nr:hypothetical protein LTR37_013571 [Vermiconidia calcicola]